MVDMLNHLVAQAEANNVQSKTPYSIVSVSPLIIPEDVPKCSPYIPMFDLNLLNFNLGSL